MCVHGPGECLLLFCGPQPAEHVTCSVGSNAAVVHGGETVYEHRKDTAKKNACRGGVHPKSVSEVGSVNKHLLM